MVTVAVLYECTGTDVDVTNSDVGFGLTDHHIHTVSSRLSSSAIVET